jgi:hypothetical protein
MAITLGDVSVIPRDCDICRMEPAKVRFVIVEPLVWSTSTLVGAECYVSHRRGVDLALARDRGLVCTEVVAWMFEGYSWGSLALMACLPLGFWLVPKLHPVRFLLRLVRRG